jgi:hypothetical protein
MMPVCAAPAPKPDNQPDGRCVIINDVIESVIVIFSEMEWNFLKRLSQRGDQRKVRKLIAIFKNNWTRNQHGQSSEPAP